ncbi:putative transferase CAF17 homolog, mitochondrial isoform X2 [Neocloeon triangulifer]|nr:putative transferase CAF17 homolog, mitochondrial isoform X2 [Neocloeon triangulifer]XP_059472578.1 putative transferase CAF17 homolog, mitochondrial isoform X2 [Neocloeon triangulifer]XP_059472579.1 putative transferase CAF17 homolog, mitochondrial isoform X2 [Neocloeon triangulifer]XP_059472580.1 putative transferase CAF17 homolog, mitochondrial isoform X2 [Neocloeon triangulifer]
MRLPILLNRSGFTQLLRKSFSTQFQSTPFILEKLAHRCVIRVSGDEALPFLQGLITNDMRHLEEGAPSMYCMFLNTKGRVIFDSIIYQENQGSLLVECDTRAEVQLKKHLTVYKVRRKIVIESCGFPVYGAFGDNAEESVQKLTKGNENLVACRDPRVKELGFRIIARNGELESTEEQNYKRLRFSLGVGEGVEELPSGNCFPMEANCDYMHGVSFHKGCYIGQELTARTHHTGVVRKRLMPLFFEPRKSLPALESPILDPQGKNVGKLRGLCESGVGIALLRVTEALRSADNLQIGDLNVKTHRPQWWPSELSKDRPEF